MTLNGKEHFDLRNPIDFVYKNWNACSALLNFFFPNLMTFCMMYFITLINSIRDEEVKNLKIWFFMNHPNDHRHGVALPVLGT